MNKLREFDAADGYRIRVFVWGKEVEGGIFAYMADEPNIEADGYIDIAGSTRYVDREGNLHLEPYRLHGKIRWGGVYQ